MKKILSIILIITFTTSSISAFNLSKNTEENINFEKINTTIPNNFDILSKNLKIKILKNIINQLQQKIKIILMKNTQKNNLYYKTTIKNNILTISGSEYLKNVEIEPVDSSLDILKLKLKKVSSNLIEQENLEIPSFISRINDFFIIENSIDNSTNNHVYIRIPVYSLKKHLNNKKSDKINQMRLSKFFVYTKVTSIHQLEPFWNPIIIDRTIVKKNGIFYLEYRIYPHDYIHFIGLE